jgi:hypothetical protein
MAMAETGLDKAELSKVFKALKNMSDGAVEEAKRESAAISEYARSSIIDSAASRQFGQAVAVRIATGAKVKYSSKIGEITYGFANQKFSGGATTKQIWGGSEFGSNKYKQFPIWSGREGRGSRGWYIYPTLRKIQPEILNRWNASFSNILKEWG